MKNIRFVVMAIGALVAPVLAQAAGWHRAFVVEWYEPAFYYGAKEGDSAPGTDCPAGSNPEMDWRKELKTSWRTDAEVNAILNPENPQRPQYGGIRGPNKENVYEKPWSVPDPGIVGVTGKLAYGFNLDGKTKTGFTGQKGEKGIDNEYYRAIGCLVAWRGPPRGGHHAKYVMDGMRDGSFTVLMIMSGKGADWRNDNDVSLGFYVSKDKMVKDANGNIAHDYTFRINPDPRYTSVINARTVNGVVENKGPVEITTRSVDRLPLILKNGQARFEFKPDGRIAGFIGGYRSIDDYYKEWQAGGAIFELTMHINIPAYWYALHKSADAFPDPRTGKNTAISTAYSFEAVPAVVITPNADAVASVAKIYDGEFIPDARRPIRPQPTSTGPVHHSPPTGPAAESISKN
jgi:hypothetical protein